MSLSIIIIWQSNKLPPLVARQLQLYKEACWWFTCSGAGCHFTPDIRLELNALDFAWKKIKIRKDPVEIFKLESNLNIVCLSIYSSQVLIIEKKINWTTWDLWNVIHRQRKQPVSYVKRHLLTQRETLLLSTSSAGELN